MSENTFGSGQANENALPDPSTLSYEQARDELVETVKILELGQMSLDESLKYWERGEALARAYGAPFCDADDLHTPAAVAKMARGEALTDEDRWPWIVRVREAAERAANPRCVVACSCLRRAYRDVLRATEMRVVFVYLPVDPAVVMDRLQRRRGHFMKADMLASQLATLEPPDADEAITVSQARVDDIVAELRDKI